MEEIKSYIIIILVLIALYYDIRTGRIPNLPVFLCTTAGIVLNLVFSGLEGLLDSLLGMSIPFLVLLWLYIPKMLGAGDIKLFCAIGSVMGLFFVIRTMVFSFLAGGIIALIFILARKNGKERFLHLIRYLKSAFLTGGFSESYSDLNDNKKDSVFPFGIAVAAGTIIASLIKTF